MKQEKLKRKNYVDGYQSIEVELTNFNCKIAPMLWRAYHMTWPSLQGVEYDKDNEIVRKACFDIIENRALPTPKESITFMFTIRNLSRVCLAQITRGRVGWWFNVESQMPEYLNHGVTIPKNIYNSKYKEEAIELIKKSQELYDKMANEGYPPQDLRYLCIHGQQTSMVANTNFTALQGFFMMRTENGLTDELNYIARLMRLEIKNKVEDAFNKKEIDSLDYDLWQLMISKLDCLGANRKVCLISDKVFGNTGRYPSGHENVPSSEGNIKPNFDFKKSAWYQELLSMDETLLLPDEKEMIDKWKN